MPKVNDIKAYWRDIATKAGLSDDELKQVSGVIENDKFAKAFSENFKPLPDYSHDLDDVRNRTKAEKDAEYREWYAKEQAKYNQWVTDLAELENYRKSNGNGTDMTTTTTANTSWNPEEINKLVDAKLQTVLQETLSRRDSAVLDLLEVRETHMNTFKKPLDVKAFESAWKDHPEWGGSLKLAYKSFVEPDVEKIKEADTAAKLDARYQEGVRDGFTRRSIPIDSQSKTFSPFFDRKEDVAKMTEGEQERHSREAFFEGLREQKQRD